jgi:hypothetical protein
MTARERLDQASRLAWEITVVAVLQNEDVEIAPYKRKAILWAKSEGCSAETIANLGQATVLANYQKFKRSGSGRQRVLRWRISAALADAIQCATVNEDVEEPMVNRICRLTGIRTSEDLWTYLHSLIQELPDEFLLNHNGDGNGDT